MDDNVNEVKRSFIRDAVRAYHKRIDQMYIDKIHYLVDIVKLDEEVVKQIWNEEEQF